MNYSQLVRILKQHPKLESAFVFDQTWIRHDYHITEVLKVLVEAIDCGGAVDAWGESVLQLVEPRHEDGNRYMIAEKALSILEKSQAKIHLNGEARLLLEYRSSHSNAAQRFEVSDIDVIDEKIVVQARGATTQCKAAVRKMGSSDSCGSIKAQHAKAKACCS